MLWTRRSRAAVKDRVAALLPGEYSHHMKSLESIIDELSKNAIKANHKHLIIRQRILEHLKRDQQTQEDAESALNEICMNMTRYNEFLNKHPEILGNITEKLAKILRQESLWIDYKNNRAAERAPTEEEKKRLDGTLEFKAIYSKVKGRKVYVEIRASRSDQLLWLEVINAAPILESDLKRISEKRNAFKKHRDAGTEYEFFLNAMDNSDCGSGLGYATIDTHLSDMGLEPLEALTVLSMHNTTVMLNIDLRKLAVLDRTLVL